ncbi:MAG: hypothetical protein ACP5G1_04775, partial [Nanopusillaceae archaeon]
KDTQYKNYTNAIANVLKNGGQVNIISYDPQYIPVLAIDSQGDLWVYMYKCSLSENQPINTIEARATSSIFLNIPMPPPNSPSSIDAYIFSQDLSSCKLLTKAEVGPLSQYRLTINIQSEGGEAGYLLVIPIIPGITPPQNSVSYFGFSTSISIQDPVYQALGVSSGQIYLYEPSTISINKYGAEVDYKTAGCILSKADKDIVSCIEFPSFFMPPSNKISQYQQPVNSFYYATMGQQALKNTVTGLPYIYYQLTT